jgi:hypothetical protein
MQHEKQEDVLALSLAAAGLMPDLVEEKTDLPRKTAAEIVRERKAARNTIAELQDHVHKLNQRKLALPKH